MGEKPKTVRNEALLASKRKEPCAVCGSSPSDAAHISSKGSGGPDVMWNVIPLCRWDHMLQHRIGWMEMAKKHPVLYQKLLELGWNFQFIGGVPKLKRK